MSGSISNFGFNMGAKMGDFGIYESNTPPTPPIPQPKYLVVNISFAIGSVGSWVANINTTGANISSVSYLTGLSNFVRVEFDNPIATNPDYIYSESFFNETWYNPSNDAIPLFQIIASPTSVDIVPIIFDNTSPLVDGDFQLSLLIFE